MNRIFTFVTASIIMVACGHIGNNDTAQATSQEAPAATTQSLDKCWKQSVEAMPGVKVQVTQAGGVKLVWTDWNQFMRLLTESLGCTYPYDAPMTEQELEGLQGKVKGLAVMGNPMSPYLYLLLQDDSVQLYSLDKMCATWDFHAGSIIGRNIARVEDEVKDYSITVLVDKDGSQTRDDDYIIDGLDLWGYMSQAGELQVEHLVVGSDGSIAYSHSNGLDDFPYQTHHGTITRFERENGDKLEAVYQYRFTTMNQDGGPAQGEKVDIAGRFTTAPSGDGRYTLVPTQGINMAAFGEMELGNPRDMLIRDKAEQYINN